MRFLEPSLGFLEGRYVLGVLLDSGFLFSFDVFFDFLLDVFDPGGCALVLVKESRW